MNGYLVAHITVKDRNKWGEYTQKASQTINAVGGEVLFKDENPEILAGQADPRTCVVLRFPDKAVLTQWYHSSEYQSLVPLREQAADVQFLACHTTLEA